MTPGDKIEEGNLGLLRAVEGFIAEGFDRGRNFREYAPYWIHQAIKRAAINSTKKLKSEE